MAIIGIDRPPLFTLRLGTIGRKLIEESPIVLSPDRVRMVPAILLCMLVGPPPPPIAAADVHRFLFDAGIAYRSWCFGRDHVRWKEDNEPWDQDYIAEADYCRRAWDLLDDCKRLFCDNEPMLIERLGLLREHLGRVRYEMGWMPPAAPFHKFREIR